MSAQLVTVPLSLLLLRIQTAGIVLLSGLVWISGPLQLKIFLSCLLIIFHWIFSSVHLPQLSAYRLKTQFPGLRL